jgi:hypothetical protein
MVVIQILVVLIKKDAAMIKISVPTTLVMLSMDVSTQMLFVMIMMSVLKTTVFQNLVAITLLRIVRMDRNVLMIIVALFMVVILHLLIVMITTCVPRMTVMMLLVVRTTKFLVIRMIGV